jgi:hypothetical protein
MKNIPWKKLTIKELAALICSELNKYNLDAVLVGGACVTIYSNNRYVSGDLDFISYDELSKIKQVLGPLGFKYEKHKYFTHKDCRFFLEFLNPPVAIGNEFIVKNRILRTKKGHIKLLTSTDCVKDRLAAYYHWNDRESLAQAILVARAQKIDLPGIKRWSKNEKQLEKFRDFIEALKK